MIDATQLMKDGYREHPCHHQPYAIRMWAKKIYAPEGRSYLYQVGFYEYPAIEYPAIEELSKGGHTWTAEVTLYSKDYDRENGDGWMTLRIHMPKTIAEVEARFERAFKVLECIPDPHNQ